MGDGSWKQGPSYFQSTVVFIMHFTFYAFGGLVDKQKETPCISAIIHVVKKIFDPMWVAVWIWQTFNIVLATLAAEETQEDITMEEIPFLASAQDLSPQMDW